MKAFCTSPSSRYFVVQRFCMSYNLGDMVKLSWWEEFIIGAAISFLSVLGNKVTNQVELAGIQAALTFLQRLAAGQVSAT